MNNFFDIFILQADKSGMPAFIHNTEGWICNGCDVSCVHIWQQFARCEYKKLLPDKVRQQLFNFLRSCQRRFAFFLVLVPAFFFGASL